MRAWFYQANFCAECGNRREPRRWWRHRYLCAECAARKSTRLYFALLVCAVVGPLLVLALSYNRRQTTLAPPPGSATLSTLPTVSALDATVQLKPTPPIQPAIYVICGGRTKRGTPCKNRVPPGQRCFQHKGRPSMIPEAISQSDGKPASKAP